MEQNKSSKSTRRRVKVYHLADKGEWEDKGTGHVDILYMEKLGCSGMVVKSEKGEEILLETKIYKPEIYQLQQDTLIVWTDPETDTELALSFQEAGGCKDIWDQIAGPDEGNEEPGYDLPSPSLSNLQKTCDIFSEPMTLYKKEKISLSLLRNNYIRKWFEVFSICEDLEDIEHLKMFFVLFKSIVILNDPSVLEYLLAPENVFDFMGTLEYDPDISKPVHHREYLKNQVVFKEVVPFENNNLVNKIHQTYRIIYLKDTVLPRALDDATYSTLNSLIFFNNVDIVSQIQSDTRFLSEVFRRIKSTDTNHNDLKDLISFIQELCNLAKALQIQNRVAFYQNLSKYGFCDIFEIALAVPLSPVRNSIVNILESVLGHDPGFLRSYILSQKPNYTFLNILIDVFIHDSEMGLRVQLSEILRVLIDTSNMEESADKDNFLTMFYSECIEKIVEPITEDKVSSSNELSMVKESICDILAFCIVHHSYRIKNFLLRQNVAENVVKLANIRDKPLTLAVVRFFRAFVGMKDEFYNRHIIKHELFGPLLKVFIENGSKYNLLNSAILELFDFIKKENIKLLVQHIAEKYRKDLESIKYVDTFTSLFLKFDQSQEDPTTPSTPPQGVKDAPSKEEDEYFSESTEEESPAAEPTNANNISSEPPPSHKRESKDDDDDIQQSPRLLKKSKISINLKSASLVPNPSEDTQNDSKGSKVE